MILCAIIAILNIFYNNIKILIWMKHTLSIMLCEKVYVHEEATLFSRLSSITKIVLISAKAARFSLLYGVKINPFMLKCSPQLFSFEILILLTIILKSRIVLQNI